MRPSNWPANSTPRTAPACAIIKHANPCGVATGESLAKAYQKALACDSVSAFGGIVAFNDTLDGEAAAEVVKIFTEVIIAPQVLRRGAVDSVSQEEPASAHNRRACPILAQRALRQKTVAGGLLVQSRDNGTVDDLDLKIVTERTPTDTEMQDLKFAFRVAKHVKSNAIVYARDGATVGIGSRADEPCRFGPHCGKKGAGCRRNTGIGRAAHQGVRGRIRRFLPVCRRSSFSNRSRRDRGHPARRLHARRRGHQSRQTKPVSPWC